MMASVPIYMKTEESDSNDCKLFLQHWYTPALHGTISTEYHLLSVHGQTEPCSSTMDLTSVKGEHVAIWAPCHTFKDQSWLNEFTSSFDTENFWHNNMHEPNSGKNSRILSSTNGALQETSSDYSYVWSCG